MTPGDRMRTGNAVRQPRAARRAWVSLVAVFVVALLGYALAQAWSAEAEADRAALSSPGVVVGTPGGAVTDAEPTPSSPPPTPTAFRPPERPSPPGTPAPTAGTEVTAPAIAASATPGATAPAAATPVPAPATPAPSPPAVIVAASSGPTDAVAAFYGFVADGNFDAAYALWSDRMKAVFPRQENLDGRFADTESISFSRLSLASHSGEQATVQANFAERYDTGGSRDFIGYWRLIRVDGAWLLDEPNY